MNPRENRTAVESPLAVRLEAAASALIAGPAGKAEENSLLRYFSYDDGDLSKAEGRARILRAAAKLRRLFLLPAPDAPGLVFFGGEADPDILGLDQEVSSRASLAGSGLSPQRAFEACVGEGIEYLSQFLQLGDVFETGLAADRVAIEPDVRRFLSDVLAVAGVDPDCAISWVKVGRLANGPDAWFPLDLCYRRPGGLQDFRPPLKLSTGCAAGPTIEAATLRGLLELIERDAVALWWRGGRRGTDIPPNSEPGEAAAELLTRLRTADGKRKTWFLDITTDLAVPVVAALSANADGYGFCFGFGARLTLVEAVRAAVFELCQVELGQHVVEAKKQESGDAALNESDLRQLRRGRFLNANDCSLLTSVQDARPCPAVFSDLTTSALRQLVDHLAAQNIMTYALDLTRSQFDVPVVRVLAPGLQLEPSQIMVPRLAELVAQTGGGALQHAGIPLL